MLLQKYINNMAKSIKKLECKMKQLKDLYELCCLDLAEMKRSFCSHTYVQHPLDTDFF